jgi:sorting nexin-7/30/sorting nexin-8
VENYEEIIECLKSENTVLSDKMDVLKIVISSPEKVEGGLFSSAYVTYLVTTTPLNFVVRRRYSDFEWLRKILTTLFPGVPVKLMIKIR